MFDPESDASREGRQEGRQLRDDALDTLEKFRGFVLGEVRSAAMSFALGRPSHEVDGDDIQLLLDRLIEINDWDQVRDWDRRFLGAVWRDGNWKKTDELRPSRLKRRHAGPVRIWRLQENGEPLQRP